LIVVYLLQDGGAGNLTSGGLFFSLVDASSGGFTLIVSKPSDATPELATFDLSGSIAFGLSSLHAVRSVVVQSSELEPDLNAYFVMQVHSEEVAKTNTAFEPERKPGCHSSWCLMHVQPSINVTGHTFSIRIEPGDLWTFTTVSTMNKGSVPTPPPPPAPFPTAAYFDDFTGCLQFQEAAYFTDQVRVLMFSRF
jgi:hypothetical protein